MAAIKYKVKLTESERTCLNEVSHRGKPSVRTVKRALALLKADQGLRDREIADVLLVNAATVARARKRCVEKDLRPPSMTDRGRAGSASWTASRKRTSIEYGTGSQHPPARLALRSIGAIRSPAHR